MLYRENVQKLKDRERVQQNEKERERKKVNGSKETGKEFFTSAMNV